MKKRLLAIMLVVAMVFTMGITVFAADDSSITINNATDGKEYSLYKVFDATYSGTGTGASAAYSYTTGRSGFKALDTALLATDSPFDLKESTTTNIYNVYMKDGKTSYDAAQFLKKNVGNLGTPATTTAADEKAVFTGLSQGYYFITTTDADGNNVIVAVLSVNGAETVDSKERTPQPPDGKYKVIEEADGSYVTETSAYYNETITYHIRLIALNSYDGKKIGKYIAYDTLGEGMENFKVVSVKVGDTELSKYSTSNPTGYKYTAQTSTAPASIEIPWVDSSNEFLYDDEATIDIKVTAAVSEDAYIGVGSDADPNTNTNNAKFNWTYTDGSKYKDNISELSSTTNTVYVYALTVYKTDNQANPLSDAKFSLLNQDGDTINFKATTETGVYEYVAAGTSGAITEAVTPATGFITIKGLKSDEADTVYYKLHETASPKGYNLLESDVIVKNSDFKDSSKSLKILIDSDGNITEDSSKAVETKTITKTLSYSSAAKNIVNNTGTELPETGGIGTTIFYIIGGAIVIGAIIFFVTRRRMDSKNKA